MKTAVSADGKIATVTGNSKWITNEKSRAHTHETRKRAAAILVGVNTVIADNPMLNCRCENPSNPIRVICDSTLRIPLNSQVVKTANEIPTYVATVSENSEKITALEKSGVHIINAAEKNNRVDLADLMKKLGEMQIDSVLIEGGGEIHASALKAGIVNKLQIYIAPKIIGGDGKNAVAPLGITLANDAVMLKEPQIRRFDDDILIEYEVM
jgi:diaminohydroxyphosphoribosylaminopyrimidine deaminase/5-amino-6-(5-phosphoribosylamino)uracil reductase